MAPDEELDLRGETCPYTFVRARLKLEELPIGARLRVVVDSEASSRNVPRSLREWGQTVHAVEAAGATWAIVVEKVRP